MFLWWGGKHIGEDILCVPVSRMLVMGHGPGGCWYCCLLASVVCISRGVISDAADDGFVLFVIYCAFMFRTNGGTIIITELSN